MKYYNDIAKQLSFSLDLPLREAQAIFAAGGKDFSKSRAGAYFKAESNERFLSMKLGLFADWLYGVCCMKGIKIEKPSDVNGVLGILEMLLDGLKFREGTEQPAQILDQLNDFSQRSE